MAKVYADYCKSGHRYIFMYTYVRMYKHTHSTVGPIAPR